MALTDTQRKFYENSLQVTKQEIGDLDRSIEEELQSKGRIVVRYSGTESLARIMIEGPEQEMISSMAQNLGKILQNLLN